MFSFVNDKLCHLTVWLIIEEIISLLLTTNQFIQLEINGEYIVMNVMSKLKVLNQLF